MKPAAKIVLAAMVAGALGVAAGLWRDGRFSPEPVPPAGVAAAGIGDPLPAIALPDLDGKIVELAGIAQGRPLLINVWASWCGPCVKEMPELDRFSREQADNGMQMVGLALDTPEAVRDFLNRVPVSYPIVLDTPGPADASVRLGNTRGLLPYSVLVGADGRIAKRKLGPFEPGEIRDWVPRGSGYGRDGPSAEKRSRP